MPVPTNDKGISMLKDKLSSMVLIGTLASSCCFAMDREIALTIDDLPFVGANNKNANSVKRSNDRIQSIIQTLVDHKIPATGFIIGEAVTKEQLPLLEEFRANGFALGNHTYSHKSLNNLSAENYIADIDKADKKLTPLLTEPKYFRYPYLAESKGEKKQQVYDYLAEHQYTIAPVTIDSKDYNFNARLLSIPWQKRAQNLKQIQARYLEYVWNQTLKAEARAEKKGTTGKQILLIHANLLNSHTLGQLIDMYQKNGYTFIGLNEAIAAQSTKQTGTAPEAVSEDATEAAARKAPETEKPKDTSKSASNHYYPDYLIKFFG
jgi:peptidoglycan/xylan/chitin deacetylase (PgdA/CDA1 family)